MTKIDPAAQDILTFWFTETDSKMRFASDPVFDAKICDRFGEVHARASTGECDHWMETAKGALALILLFDQFSRNLYRGEGQAFATDAKAMALADAALEAGHDMATDKNERAFFYLPYMHAEDLAAQEKCIALIKERLGEDSANLSHAIWHRDVIEKFGRFPFRNKALGRASTPEEEAFLNKENVPG